MTNGGRVRFPLPEPQPVSVVVLTGGELRAMIAQTVSEVLDSRTPPAPTAPRPVTAAPEYLTTCEAATLLRFSPRALEAMRSRGGGPPFVRIGRIVRYPRAELLEFGTRAGGPDPRRSRYR